MTYRVQCDETLNTPDVIERNELRANIFITPTRSVEFCILSKEDGFTDEQIEILNSIIQSELDNQIRFGFTE